MAKWLIVAVLFVVSALNYGDRSAITALFPLLRQDLGLTDVGLGLIGSFFLWSYAFSSPLSGYLGDRFDRGKLVVYSLAAWSLVTLLTGLVTAQWQLFALRTMLGVTESLFLPAAVALAASYHGPETRATAVGMISLGTFAGLISGGTLAGYLGALYGWRAPLLALGAGGMLLAPLCYFLLPRQTPSTKEEEDARPPFLTTAASLVRVPSYLVMLAAGLLPSIGSWIFINWLPLYFQENFHMSLARAGFYGSSLIPIGSAISQVVGGPISDFIARRGVHYRMLMQACLILCAAPALLTFVLTQNQNLIIGAIVVYAMCRSCGDLNILPLLYDLVGKSKASTAYGIANMMNTIAGGLGVFVAGWVKADFGLAGVFAVVAGILAFDALLLFICYAFFLRKDLAAAR